MDVVVETNLAGVGNYDFCVVYVCGIFFLAI